MKEDKTSASFVIIILLSITISFILLLINYRQKENLRLETISSNPETNFCYKSNKKCGPDNWALLHKKNQKCGFGTMQSPINIITDTVKNNVQVSYNYYESTFALEQDANALHLYPKKENNYLISEKGKYYLIDIHFHVPSENYINSNRYDSEIHFVHKDQDQNLLVLAIMIQETEFNNNALDPIIEPLIDLKPNQQTSLSPLDLLPKEREFYSFDGSLTTPPCLEGVQWYVLSSHITASKDQIEQIQKITGDNARPLQNTNNRTIILNKPIRK